MTTGGGAPALRISLTGNDGFPKDDQRCDRTLALGVSILYVSIVLTSQLCFVLKGINCITVQGYTKNRGIFEFIYDPQAQDWVNMCGINIVDVSATSLTWGNHEQLAQTAMVERLIKVYAVLGYHLLNLGYFERRLYAQKIHFNQSKK